MSVSDYIYDGAVERIQGVYQSCSPAEQSQLRNILEEMADKGYSETLENIWLTDFKEIPVGIDQFICDPHYMGGVNRNGDAIYPFWRNMFRDIFNHGNQYNEIILSGSTRIGKTSSSIVIATYMLYRLMLYRNPHEYFKKKEVSRFTIAFANLTKDLAMSVAYREYNDTLRDCPWFMERGRISASDRNFYYVPEGDKIEIIPISDGSQALGKQLWCVVGSTKIVTTEGIQNIEDLAGRELTVFQWDGNDYVESQAEVQLTRYTQETIRIELEDGSVIEGTPDHRVMLADGSYKRLDELTSSDDLLTLDNTTEVDQVNLKDTNARFLVYVHTSPKGKRYVGITSKSPNERWKNGKGYIDNAHFWNAICQYGWDNFSHDIVATDLSLEEACALEVELISKYDAMDPNHGYNHTTGGNWSTPDDETRKRLSRAIKRSRKEHPEIGKKIADSLKGHAVSEEARKKISKANLGRKLSEEQCAKRRGRKLTEEQLAKRRGHSSWCKGLTVETDERVRRISESQKGKIVSPEARARLSASRKAQYADGYAPRWITNGVIETSIQEGDPLPEGFRFGRLGNRDIYIHRGNESKKVSKDELDSYLKDGWELGRPSQVNENIRKSLQRMYWVFDGQRFETAEMLASHLRQNGYPKIVGSTITNLANRGFEKSPTYISLAGRIERVYL